MYTNWYKKIVPFAKNKQPPGVLSYTRLSMYVFMHIVASVFTDSTGLG